MSCDVIFVDTSSTYWEVDVADEEIELSRASEAAKEKEAEAAGNEVPAVPGEAALRQFSKHSKDHRSDLPQVVIAMAVTSRGIPIRCWTFPGRTSDQLVIRRIKDDLGSWMLNRVVWVTNSGFNSGTNRAYLQRGGDHYIVCEKLRSASQDAKKALARPGRYHLVEHNLQVKEVRVGIGARSERFVVCVDPEARSRDEIVPFQPRCVPGEAHRRPRRVVQRRRQQLVGELRQTPGVARSSSVGPRTTSCASTKAAIAKDAQLGRQVS